VNECEFWLALEYRLSREFGRLASNDLRFLWCDGFERADALVSAEGSSWVTGRAFISEDDGRSFVEYRFELGPVARQRSEIDWGELLPDDSSSGWLHVDRGRKELRLLVSRAGSSA
jgi:hypothetical protein